jgi:SAM-dependent methyltransferase
VQTKFPFAEEEIACLYSDYRSDSYNRERSRYEPSYAAIADKIGPYRAGDLDRVSAMTQWLKSKVNLSGRSMLDFGGADGQFLPAIEGDKYVFEVSEIEPMQGVVRISDESLLRTYSYIQLSHVLEHVTQPLEMVKQVSRYLAEDGCLLIEVPQDIGTTLLEQLQAGRIGSFIAIHEHINLYSLLAVQKLILAAGLEIISVEAFPVVSPVAKQDFIHALARRPVGAQ